jgi:hypothetical protein
MKVQGSFSRAKGALLQDDNGRSVMEIAAEVPASSGLRHIELRSTGQPGACPEPAEGAAVPT